MDERRLIVAEMHEFALDEEWKTSTLRGQGNRIDADQSHATGAADVGLRDPFGNEFPAVKSRKRCRMYGRAETA